MAQMVQDPQNLKNKIIAALDLLSLDNLQILYRFVAFLRTDTQQPPVNQVENFIGMSEPHKFVRLTSPRLVHRHQAADFAKEIVEFHEDESL